MNPATEIQRLKDAGYRVRVRHFRRPIAANGRILSHVTMTADRIHKEKLFGPHPQGGSTLVQIEVPPGGHGVSGEAHCSRHDNFNRKLGLRIALGRALKHLGETDGAGA